MEQEINRQHLEKSIPARLARGLGNTMLNPFRVIGEFINFDPSPDAISSIKPGIFSEFHQIKQELQGKS
jgi:hypothetical protein